MKSIQHLGKVVADGCVELVRVSPEVVDVNFAISDLSEDEQQIDGELLILGSKHVKIFSEAIASEMLE